MPSGGDGRSWERGACDGGRPADGRRHAESAQPANHDRSLRGVDQAADHRAAPRHHDSHDDPGRGRPPVPHVGSRHASRRHPRRGQREHPQLRLRRRHRPAHAPHAWPSAGRGGGLHPRRPRVRPRARRSVGDLAGGRCQHAVGGARPRSHRLLRPRLHDGVEASYLAEHRLGWCCGVHAGADRLGGRHGVLELDTLGPVRRDLLLDAAALLAAVPAVPRRLRLSRHSHAARRGAARGRRSTDRGVQLGHGCLQPAPVGCGADDVVLRLGGPGRWRYFPRGGSRPAAPGPQRCRQTSARCGCSTDRSPI